MTSNPNLTITRDQIPAVDQLADTAVERELFDSGKVEAVPTLPQSEEEEIDLFFDKAVHKDFFERGDDFDQMIQRVRSNLAAAEKRLEAEGGRYEQIAKDLAANRRAEEAKELAQDLKEINVRTRASFKEAARELLRRLETAPAAKIKDETLERKVAKAEKQAAKKERRAAFVENLKKEVTHFGKTKERRREAVREALRAGYRPPEKKARVAAPEKKLPEPQTLQEVMPQLQERLQARLKDTVNDIEKKVQDIRRMEQGPIDTKQVAIDNDVLLNLIRLKRVIEADLAAMDANAAEGKGFEDALKAAEAELAAEEAKVDKEGIAAAEKALAEAQTSLDRAEALKKETDEALQKDNDLIARLEKKLETAPQRHIPPRPIELRLEALHPHAIGLRDAFREAERDEAKAQASLEEKKSALEALTAGVKAAEGKVAAARLPMEAWKRQKGTDKDPAMIAGRKEFDRIQKARAAILDAHFGGAKGDAVDTTLFRLPLDQLQKHVDTFETASRNDPTNPVLSEMATRYRSELDEQTRVSEAARRDAEQTETDRQQQIENVKRDHQIWLGHKEATEKMLISSDPVEQSIGRRAMSDLLKKRDEISSRLRELGGGFTWEELQTLKPIPLSGTERKRWRGKYAPRVGRVIEGIPTDDETLARLGLDRMNTPRLEKLYDKLTSSKKPLQPTEQQEADLMEGLLIDRRDKSAAWDAKWHALSKERGKAEMAGEREAIEFEKLNALTTDRLEEILSELHGATAQADVPSDDDVRRSETIKRILLERSSEEPDVPNVEAQPTPEETEEIAAKEWQEKMRKRYQDTQTTALEAELASLHAWLEGQSNPKARDLERTKLIEEALQERSDRTPDVSEEEAKNWASREQADREELQTILEKLPTDKLEAMRLAFQTKIETDTVPKEGDVLRLEVIDGLLQSRSETPVGVEIESVSDESDLDEAMDAKRAGERDVQEERTEDVEEAAIAAELSPRRQTHRRTEKARKIIVDGLPNRRETATMDEAGNVRYEEDTATDKDAQLVGNTLEAVRAWAAVDKSKVDALRTQGMADVAASHANVTPTEAMLKREAEAKAQAREEAEDTTAVLARAKALFKETPAEKREQASKVPLSELAVMIQKAKDASVEKRKTEPDPEGLQLISDLQGIFKSRIDTPEKIRAEIKNDPNQGMRAQLEKLLPATEETSAA